MNDLWNGIVRYPIKTLQHVFIAFSVMWTIIEGLNYFVPGINIKGMGALGGIVFISIIYAFKQVWKPCKIEIKVSNSNTIIEVLFGDLFQQEGMRAIAVNDFFDSKLGRPVSDISL